MKELTLGILGNDYIKTTEFIEKIINNTKARIDQEHIKMNIIINNKLLEKSELELLEIIKTMENIDSNLLCLCIDDEKVIHFIKNNTNIKVIDNNINSILEIFEGKDNLWKELVL